MGYVREHPRFPKPDDLDATLWRYMDFTKLVALLHARALYFSRADQLDDRFDGSVSEKTRLYRWAIHSELEPIKRAHLSGQLSFINEVMPRHTHLNCWSIAPRESAALWRVFVPTDEGVAVRSTFRRLTESLPADEGPDIFVGMVTYLDYDNEWVPEGNTSAPFMHKRAYYDYESEVRALIQDIPTRDGQADSSSPGPEGILVPVDLNELVASICVSPFAADHFLELVESVVKRYGLACPVAKSSMAGTPAY